MNNMYPIHTIWSNEQISHWQDQVEEALTPIRLASYFSLKSEEVVGHAHNIYRCPVQNYLNEVLPHLDAEVGPHQIKTQLFFSAHLFQHGRFKGLVVEDIYYLGQPSLNNRPMPEWLTKFVKLIDQRFCYNTELGKKISSGEIQALYHECDFPVTGEQALALLQEVCPELKPLTCLSLCPSLEKLIRVRFLRARVSRQIIKGVELPNGQYAMHNPVNSKELYVFSDWHHFHTYWEAISEEDATYLGLPA